jgi:hypothetical protein
VFLIYNPATGTWTRTGEFGVSVWDTMMRVDMTRYIILPLALAVVAFGQGPKRKVAPKPVVSSLKQTAAFDFHGDALGEEWNDFQKRHTDTGTTCWGSAAVLKDHGLQDPFPRDPGLTKLLPPSPPPPETGILYCEIKGEHQTLVGMPVDTKFEFFADKLFQISIFRSGGIFEVQPAHALIKSSFTERPLYGPIRCDLFLLL